MALKVHRQQKVLDRWDRFVQSICLEDLWLTPTAPYPIQANMGHHQLSSNQSE